MEDKQDKIELLKNKLIIIVLTLLAIFLFFKVYVYFSKPINIVLGALFPFVLSFVIVYCLMPFIDLLNHKFKMRRKLAILIVLTIFVLIFGYITFTLVPLVIKQLSGLINYFIENQTAIQTRLSDFLSTNNIDLKETVIKSKEVIFNNILGVLNFSVSFLTGIFSLLFMTPVFTIMLIFSFDSIEKGLRNTLIKLRKQEVLPLLKSIDEAIGKYVKVTVLDCLIIGIESYILFSYLKLPYVQLFALIIGIGNLIPFIGPFIGLVPVLIYANTIMEFVLNNISCYHNTSRNRGKYCKTIINKQVSRYSSYYNTINSSSRRSIVRDPWSISSDSNIYGHKIINTIFIQ